jgi:hypothetical protein
VHYVNKFDTLDRPSFFSSEIIIDLPQQKVQRSTFQPCNFFQILALPSVEEVPELETKKFEEEQVVEVMDEVDDVEVPEIKVLMECSKFSEEQAMVEVPTSGLEEAEENEEENEEGTPEEEEE